MPDSNEQFFIVLNDWNDEYFDMLQKYLCTWHDLYAYQQYVDPSYEVSRPKWNLN